MTLKASSYRNYSITVALFQPLVIGGAYIKTLEQELTSYSHTISANGGFTSASIAMNISPQDIDDWILNGLGRHIVVYGTGGEIAWEGFIDALSINIGNDTIERGKLSDICNRCMLTYTPVTIEENTEDPVSGTTTNTLAADEYVSIEKYGIWEQIVSGGSIAGVNGTTGQQILDIIDRAEGLRNIFLSENKEPQTSHNPIIGINSGGEIVLTLECAGYKEWLSYVYNFTTIDPVTGSELAEFSIAVSDKLKAVITADPNNIISRTFSGIRWNGMIINAIEKKDRTAITVIDETISVGDINGNRWIFGIYEDRQAYFNPISTTVDYLYYVSTQSQKLLTFNNNLEVLPWNARPGKLLFLPDTILGGLPETDVRSDPRVMLIEEINFTAPDTLNISGKKIRNFEQLQAALGLG